MKFPSFFDVICIYFLLPLFTFFSNIFRLERAAKHAPHTDKEDHKLYYSSIKNQDLRFKFKFRTLDEYRRIPKGRDETGLVFSASVEEPVRENSDNMMQAQMNSSGNFLSEGDFREEFEENLNSLEFLSEKDFNSEMHRNYDANRLESLWEHQELIEQLKMELKNIKATGLPTILEESETEELKSWKMMEDDNLQHQECMDELHKFHKSYTETMRKFDILNYQKMYAMGFLQLKDPFQQPKHSPPTLKSLVSQNLWLSKHKTHGSAPIKKFINELEGDLEAVYVGQMCLSWEFLHYQYQKALDLWNSDPNGIHRYNEVAGEFQQFQVLLQQFIEDEAIQGPRVHNYVRNRCVLRKILQVPAIREDKVKGRRREREQKESVITSENLVQILEESIGTMWRFVRSDKECSIPAIKKSAQQFLNARDIKLLADVRKVLQKKDRKLKEIVRSEKCILRKWQQNKEEDWEQVLHFFAQVDIKLISRILNMSRTTRDQLLWCQDKLSRITFLNNKILVHPTFLIFPCT